MKNKYTLITGAGEGFGKALAVECARRNMNLILVALPGPEIFFLAGFLKNKYGVDVVAVEKDLCLETGCADLFHEVSEKQLEVNMLINNAGIGSTVLFHEGDAFDFERQIKLNVLATTMLTKFFFGMLKCNAPSYILNVGSMASFFCLPKKNVYGATKSFIYAFSKSLRKEARKEKIYVSVLCPGVMNTNMRIRQMTDRQNYLSRLAVMDPEKVGPVAVSGLLKQKEVIIPGKLNRLVLIVSALLPEFIKRKCTGYIMRLFKSDPLPVRSFSTTARIQAGTKVA